MPLSAKYGIISDIHANYTALKVVLDYLQMAGVDKILCLGDLVGYGAEPFECIQAVKDKPNIYTIAGNHDRQVIGDKDARMRKTAAKVLEWTADNISPSNARFLKSIPQGMTVDALWRCGATLATHRHEVGQGCLAVLRKHGQIDVMSTAIAHK